VWHAPMSVVGEKVSLKCFARMLLLVLACG